MRRVVGDRSQGDPNAADQRKDLLRAGGPKRRKTTGTTSRLCGSNSLPRWPRRRLGETLDHYPKRQRIRLGARGAGQPGARGPRFGLELPELFPSQTDGDQTDFAPGHVGAVVGLVEGARRRTAGNPRRGIRLGPLEPTPHPRKPASPDKRWPLARARARANIHRPPETSVPSSAAIDGVMNDRTIRVRTAECQACSVIHIEVKRWISGIPWANSRAMKLSIVAADQRDFEFHSRSERQL